MTSTSFFTNLECNVNEVFATEEERKNILEKNGLLTDRHMFGGHKLLKEAFPDLDGFQDTIFSQKIELCYWIRFFVLNSHLYCILTFFYYCFPSCTDIVFWSWALGMYFI